MLAPEEWEYRLEGAAHIVFAHRTPRLPYRGMLLRFETEPLHPNQSTPDPARKQPDANLPSGHDFISAVFGTSSLAPYLLPSDTIQLEPSFLQGLVKQAEHLRPPHRKALRCIPTNSVTAFLEKDLALLFGKQTICVEVKPKYAFLSRSRLVDPVVCSALDKFGTPTYHVKNYGFRAGIVPQTDKKLYYPADVFSGDRSRLAQALEALRCERSRILRVFSSGALTAAAKSVFKGELTFDAFDSDGCKAAIELAVDVLTAESKGCLDAVALFQQLDYIDNIGAETLWRRLVSLLGEVAANKEVVKGYFARATRGNDKTSDESDILFARAKETVAYRDASEAKTLHNEQLHGEAEQFADSLAPETLARMLSDFMVASVAKDCSIFLSMCPSGNAEAVDPDHSARITASDGQEWIYAAHVIDLEPKSLGKIISKWAPVDRQRASEASATNMERDASDVKK